MSLRKKVLPLVRFAKKKHADLHPVLKQDVPANEHEPGVTDNSPLAETPKPSRRIDHTMVAALKQGVLSQSQIDNMSATHDVEISALTWRHCALAYPESRTKLQALAADIYGFRTINACQIGTLIYNQVLFEKLPNSDWAMLFDASVVPVIEYGNYPETVENHLLATADPGSSGARSLSRNIRLSKIEFVFIPETTVKEIQHLLVSNLPALNLNPAISDEMVNKTPETQRTHHSGLKAA